MSSTSQALLQALQALYHGTPAVKEEANKWLEQFQQSTEAWQVTNDILHDAAAGMEAHYFCAQTLRTKASPCWLVGCSYIWGSVEQAGGMAGQRPHTFLPAAALRCGAPIYRRLPRSSP